MVFDSSVPKVGAASPWKPGSHFRFLQQAEGETWNQVRTLVEGWYEGFPPTGKAHLLSRLKSPSSSQFRSGFFELYCHELLRRLGQEIIYEPDSFGERHRPDFHAIGATGNFLFEAVTVGDSNSREGRENEVNRIHQALHELEDDTFSLVIQVVAEGRSSPAVKRLSKRVRAELDRLKKSLSPVTTAGLHSISSSTPVIEWERHGWVVEVRPVLGAGSTSAIGSTKMFHSDVPGIVSALEDKGALFKSVDIPYVIGVDFDPQTPTDSAMSRALLGTPASQPFFPAGRMAHVSAVMSVCMLYPATVAQIQPTLLINPGAKHQLQLPDAPWRIARLGANGSFILEESSRDMHQFLGLPRDWPSE